MRPAHLCAFCFGDCVGSVSLKNRCPPGAFPFQPTFRQFVENPIGYSNSLPIPMISSIWIRENRVWAVGLCFD